MLFEDVTEQIGVDVRLQAVVDAIAAAGHEQLQHLIGDRGYVVVGIDGGAGAVGKRLGQKVFQALSARGWIISCSLAAERVRCRFMRFSYGVRIGASRGVCGPT